MNFLRILMLLAIASFSTAAFVGCEVDVDEGPLEDAAEELEGD